MSLQCFNIFLIGNWKIILKVSFYFRFARLLHAMLRQDQFSHRDLSQFEFEEPGELPRAKVPGLKNESLKAEVAYGIKSGNYKKDNLSPAPRS